MRRDHTKIALSVLARVIGFVVACGVSVLVTAGYNALPDGTMRVVAGLFIVFGIPQVVAVGVGLRARRHGEAGALLRGAAAAAVSGFAVAWAVMALQASEPPHAECGLAALAGLFFLGFMAVVNAGWALVTTAIAMGVAQARSPRNSMAATTPN
jgi:hypothetical protein